MLVSDAVSLAPRTCEPADENSSVLFRELAMLGIISQGYRLSGLPIYVSSESFVYSVVVSTDVYFLQF